MIKATERILRFFLTAVGMAGFCLFLLPVLVLEPTGKKPAGLQIISPGSSGGKYRIHKQMDQTGKYKRRRYYCLWVIRGSIGSSQSRGNR